MKPTLNPHRTTTAEAILGILSLKPMSGYEIRQMIDQSTGNFWSESFGQIYPTLKRLAAEGFVVGREENGRTCYHLTDGGRERLEVWLGVPARTQVPRNELLLKLFFGSLADAATARAQVEAKRAECVANMARYRVIEAQMMERHVGHPGLPYWRFTVRYGLAEAQALVAWADETLAELDAMERRERAPQTMPLPGRKRRDNHAR